MDGKRPATAGFTLLEIMIALAIVAIALIALLGLLQRSITANDLAQRVTRATLLAQEQLALIEAGLVTITEEEQSFAAPDADYRWRVEVSPAPVSGIQQIELIVAWGDEDRNEAVRLVSFIPEGEGP